MISKQKVRTMCARVDAVICTGCETCVSVCPQLFEMRGGVAVLRMSPLPAQWASEAREAANACPVDAIAIVP